MGIFSIVGLLLSLASSEAQALDALWSLTEQLPYYSQNYVKEHYKSVLVYAILGPVTQKDFFFFTKYKFSTFLIVVFCYLLHM